jgi:hypothetical protein
VTMAHENHAAAHKEIQATAGTSACLSHTAIEHVVPFTSRSWRANGSSAHGDPETRPLTTERCGCLSACL